MAFTLAAVESIKINVSFNIPVDAGKKKKKGDFTVEFKKNPVSETKELIKQLGEDDHELTDDDVLEEDIVNIEGLLDTDGNDLEYSVEVLHQLLEEDYIRKPLMETWLGLNFGQEMLKAFKAKN